MTRYHSRTEKILVSSVFTIAAAITLLVVVGILSSLGVVPQ